MKQYEPYFHCVSNTNLFNISDFLSSSYLVYWNTRAPTEVSEFKLNGCYFGSAAIR